MSTVEILAGEDFANAVYQLGLTSAICTFHRRALTDSYCEDFQVWLLSNEDFQNLCAVNNADWQDDWGWWRYAVGSNLGKVDHTYTINGREIQAWDGPGRLTFRRSVCSHCAEQDCKSSDRDILECHGDRNYDDILDYIYDEIGASTSTNVCAIAIDLAKQNHMMLSDLFQIYSGEEQYEYDAD